MSKAKLILEKLILEKHARGEYEIGIQTEDGAVVAHVTIWAARLSIGEARASARKPQWKRLGGWLTPPVQPLPK